VDELKEAHVGSDEQFMQSLAPLLDNLQTIIEAGAGDCKEVYFPGALCFFLVTYSSLRPKLLVRLPCSASRPWFALLGNISPSTSRMYLRLSLERVVYHAAIRKLSLQLWFAFLPSGTSFQWDSLLRTNIFTLALK
jgi:hypothetical protein